MINVGTYGVIFIGGWTVVLELPERQRYHVLRAYLAGLGVFLAVGLWQWANFYLGVPFPDLGSRTYLHSVSTEISNLFPGRITSLATEPSFLAPLVIDAALVGAGVMGLTRRYFLLFLLPSMWLLLFSFSGGGFFNLVVLALFGSLLAIFDVFSRRRIPGWLIALVTLGGTLIFTLQGRILRLVEPVAGRMTVMFDLQAHDRLYMVVMPFTWFVEDGFVAAMFGHGPGSYALLGQMYTLPDGGPVHVTSNNLFADVLYEHGALGFVLALSLFVTLLAWGLRGRRRDWRCLIGALLTVHLATSSVYRADFMAPRFWVLLLSICILYRSGSCSSADARRSHAWTSTNGGTELGAE